MLRRIASFVVALVALVAMPRAALAHQVGLSRGDYTRDVNGVHVDVVLARGDATTLDLTRGTDPSDLVAIESGGVRCSARIESLEPTAADGLEMRAAYTCPHADAFAVEAKLVDTLGGGHRHLARASMHDFVLKEHATKFEIAQSAQSAESPTFVSLVAMGVEHILRGWDHLVFLFGLLLLGGRMRSLAGTITAFTVAHSITLGLAAFAVWTPPASVVEPAIALSIAYVGVENIRALVGRRDRIVAETRWRITFPFGLVHGFGFASALRDLGMARADVPKALVGFNVGVEIGQLAVVVPLALGLAWFARRGKLPIRVTSFASAVIVVLGIALFVARIA